jgi:hypothetical protein
MENTLSLIKSRGFIKSALFDILALAFIYFLPTITHFFSFPLYYADPMRIVLILCLAHTSKSNSLLIALTLPVFSFIIASHPSMYKSMLIASELILNLFLFYFISQKIKNIFGSMLISIALSKMFYYLAKYFFISGGLIEGDLVTTPILIQTVAAVVFSLYAYFILRNRTEQ